MNYAYRCDTFGPMIVDGPDPVRCACGKSHRPYPCGVERASGLGRGLPPFKRFYSFQHGRKLESWDEYRRANRELGLVDAGRKLSKHGGPKIEKPPDTGRQMMVAADQGDRDD